MLDFLSTNISSWNEASLFVELTARQRAQIVDSESFSSLFEDF